MALAYMSFWPVAFDLTPVFIPQEPKKGQDIAELGELTRVPDNFKRVLPSVPRPGMTAENLPLVRRLGL